MLRWKFRCKRVGIALRHYTFHKTYWTMLQLISSPSGLFQYFYPLHFIIPICYSHNWTHGLRARQECISPHVSSWLSKRLTIGRKKKQARRYRCFYCQAIQVPSPTRWYIETHTRHCIKTRLARKMRGTRAIFRARFEYACLVYSTRLNRR